MQNGDVRVCKQCEEERPTDYFYEGRAVCKSCVYEYARGRYASLTPEERTLKNRRDTLSKVYKLTLEQYEELSKDGCAVCGTFEKLCVDHDHNCCPGKYTCGQCVRGVLCSKHNKGEGAFETIDEIVSLLAYRIKFERVGTEIK